MGTNNADLCGMSQFLHVMRFGILSLATNHQAHLRHNFSLCVLAMGTMLFVYQSIFHQQTPYNPFCNKTQTVHHASSLAQLSSIHKLNKVPCRLNAHCEDIRVRNTKCIQSDRNILGLSVLGLVSHIIKKVSSYDCYPLSEAQVY